MSDPSPKAFLQARRPGKFSDSTIIKSARLNRSMLDQHLETLTTRNQDHEFAEFARRLCELEICPNLRPQTGPVGGGDSKVDTETIPVSSQIQILYYQGSDNQSNRSFAFAISAKKKWTEKVRSDVRKIFSLEKKYDRVYFITNQPTKDKTRADIEAELSSESGKAVTILDKTWILDKVFTNKREKLAIEMLEMGFGLEEEVEVGPLDLQRRKKLEELNSLLEESTSHGIVNYSTVDKALEAALISAALELPRVEIDGHFERAIRLAREYGNKEHLFSALYQKAWRTFFWFEDFQSFINQYNDVEAVAIESENVFSIERMSNLLTLLRILFSKHKLITKGVIEDKTLVVRDLMEKVANNTTNPSASVHAQALRCILILTNPEAKKEELAGTFNDLGEILDQATNLIGFPFETIVNALTELDFAFSGIGEYEALQDRLIDVISSRRGEIPAAESLLQRGVQHLDAKRYYQAIISIGRSLHKFFKQESKEELIKALALLSFAYKEVGLLWAARGALLNAASIATSEFTTYNEINVLQLSLYEEMRLTELQLGRIGAAMDWHSIAVPMAMELVVRKEDRDKVYEESMRFGMILGLLLLKTREADLKSIERLPDTLLGMDLEFAALGLIYRLGGKTNIPEEMLKQLDETDVDQFFRTWLKQPAQKDLPSYPDYYLSDLVQLRSRTLGCELIINTKNSSPEIDIGEYLLAAIESFLSTTVELGAITSTSKLIIDISKDESLGTDLLHEINSTNSTEIRITCGDFNPNVLSGEEQKFITNKVSEIVLLLVGKFVVFSNPKLDLEKLFRDEEAGLRSFSFASPLIRLGNVVGAEHRRSISDWIDKNSKVYPYVPGSFLLEISDHKASDEHVDVDPKSLPKHSDLFNNSIIRIPLWEKAGWHGALYLTAPHIPPVFGLLFRDKTSAKAIFEEWQSTFGREDTEDTIRVAVARGVDYDHPAWYTIGVGTKIDKSKFTRLTTVTRLHTMNPETTVNLDRFSESFKKWGYYLLAPVLWFEGEASPTILYNLGIVKHEFTDREAWGIGPNDLDLALITLDSKPLIPEDVDNAPVLELIKKIKE